MNMNLLRPRTVAVLAAAALCAGSLRPVLAVPTLQLYVEGATYDYDHESWVFDAVLGDPIRLWVIGNTGQSSDGVIHDVKLAVVYPDPLGGDGGSLDLTLTGSTTGGFAGFTDPSVAADPVFSQLDEDGNLPRLSSGKKLSPHGVYGPGAEWQEFLLGDFTLADSPIGDFIDNVPTPGTLMGQINVYELTVTAGASVPGLTDIDLHFDAYDGIMSGNHLKARFAPYSHDAGTGTNDPEPVPEPDAALMLGLGLAGLGIAALVRRRRR